MKNGKPFPIPVRARTSDARVRYSCAKCPAYCCSYPDIEVTPRDIERLGKRFELSYREAEERFTKSDAKEKLRPGEAPLHGVRVAPGRLPHLSREQALRLLRFPALRARAPGRSGIHRFDLNAFSRIAERVVAGVIASGSMRSSISAGLPDFEARSNAGAKSSVRSTVSPWPPKARA